MITERTLLAAAKAGDNVSRDTLAKRFFGLVDKLIARRECPTTEMDGLRATGRLAIFKGIDLFSLTTKNPLGTFMARHIEKSIRKSLGEPVDGRRRRRPYTTSVAVEKNRGLEYYLGMLLKELGVQNHNPRLDMDAWLSLIQAIPHARYRDILELRFGLDDESRPRTFRQIADVFGVSTQRAQQLNVCALRSLRKSALKNGLLEVNL